MAFDHLSIVIVSFNTRLLLRRCLASIVNNPYHALIAGSAQVGQVSSTAQTKLRCEVIVVDNASDDGSAEMVEREYPGVILIRAGENLGFARGTNLGLRASSGNPIMLLNPDTEVIGDALPALAEYLYSNPGLAAVSPALLFPDGRPQHGAFRFPTLWMSLLDFFPLNHRLIDSPLNGRYRVPTNGEPFAVDHPLGAAMMIRREALDDVGMLDESFFMYCEEVDWCLRATKAGWQIYQMPSAKVVHHVGQSTKQFRDAMFVELHRSRYYLFSKHYPQIFLKAHRAITRLGIAKEWIKAVWLARRGLITDDELGSRLQAYRTIWRM